MNLLAKEHMMTPDKMRKILLEVTNGAKAPENENAEDARVRATLTRQVAEIAARGHIVDIPS